MAAPSAAPVPSAAATAAGFTPYVPSGASNNAPAAPTAPMNASMAPAPSQAATSAGFTPYAPGTTNTAPAAPVTPSVPVERAIPQPLGQTETTTPQPSIGSLGGTIMKALGDWFHQSAAQATNSVSQIGAGLKEAQSGENPISPVEGALNVGAGAVGAITSPLAPLFAPVGAGVQAVANKVSDIPAVQKFAMSGAGQTTSHIAQDVANASTIAGAVAGGENPSEVAGAVSDTAKAAVDNMTPDIGAINAKIQHNAIQNSIQDTMPLPTKDVRIDALRNTLPDSSSGTGGVNRTGIMSKSTIQPSAEDVARGTIAHPFIAGVSDPVAKIANVNQAIADTSKGVDNFLDQNSSPANFSDMRDYVEANNTPSTNLQKDTTAYQAYQRSSENALDTLYKTMKGTAKGTGDFGPVTPGSDIRAARIAVDQQITKELGEETFGSPQFKGIKAAEVSVRNTLNRLSEDMVRYPGQLHELNGMNNFISQARGRGVDIDMNDPAVRSQLEAQFKLNPSGEAKADAVSAVHKNMSRLYDARDNMIDKYQSSIGKSKAQEYLKAHPIVNSVVKTAANAAKMGAAVKIGLGEI